MSWDAPPPGEPQRPLPHQPQPEQPPQQWAYPSAPPASPTQPYGHQYDGPYFPPYQGYPPPKRNRNGWLVGLGVAGVVVAISVAAGVALTASGSSSGPVAVQTSAPARTTASGDPSASAPPDASAASQSTHTVAVPDVAGPMRLLSNSDTARRISDIESNLRGNAAYSDPRIGFYTVGSDSDYSVWMLAEDTSDISVVRTSVDTLGDAGMARQIARGAKMTDVTSESPGPLGGAMLCGKLAIDGSEFRVCEWVDHTTFGWVYFMPSVSEDDVLTYALDLRGAAER